MAVEARTGKNRLIAINTPLGEDKLLLKGIQMTEELGRPFSAQLDLRSEEAGIVFEDIIAQNVTVRIFQTDGKTRYINGWISRFIQEGTPSQGRANRYRAEMVPWLWFLTRSSDCRIFQDKKIPDIIKEVFRDHGFADFEDCLTGSYVAKEYVVQYRETAFNFVSRLMEEEGIYYFFRHEDGKHTLVMADAPSAHEVVEGYENVPYVQQEKSSAGRERVWEWMIEKHAPSVKFQQTDFDFKAPKKNLLTNKEFDPGFQPAYLAELFDYPCNYTEKAEGERYAGLRTDELASQYEICRARGDARGLVVGAKFKLTEFPREDQERDYIVTSAFYHAETDEYGSGKSGGGQMYECGFSAIDATTPYRTPRTTPKPLISGPQTAIVTGPAGEEINTDEFGRIKVHFHWDRWDAADEKSSCWIRVAQMWAGKAWGGMFVPRIGQEVIVEFLEADPDRPIVTGRVYNGECKVPYALPDNKTMSTVKSNSSKGGGGFNELRFEDKAGSEQVFVHAEKQLDIRVKADRYETIGHDRHLVVENDKFEHIKANRHEVVDACHKETIKVDRNLAVLGKEAVEITGSKSLTVTDDVIEVFKANQSTQVTGDVYIKAENIILEAGTNITLKVGSSSWLAIEASSIDTKTKNQTHTTETKFLVDSKLQFEIKATATGKITTGLSLKASTMGMLTLEGIALYGIKGRAGSVKATAKLDLKGAITNVG